MAVYTHITRQDLERYLTAFDLGQLQDFSGITEGVENTNYRLATARGTFILTLFEKRVRPEDLPFCLGFMEYLHGHGIPCPAVIRSKAGGSVTALNGRPAAITAFLPGQWPRQVENFHAAAIGALLARMHAAGAGFGLQRPNALSLPAWQKLIEESGPDADRLQAGLYARLQQELLYIGENRPQGLPQGAVHADLFPDNVFFSGREISGVIDFYFSCTEAFAYDLMLTLNAWCFDAGGAFDPDKAQMLLGAYQKLRPLLPAERRALPCFGRAAALRIIATRLYDWLHPAPGALIQPKDPLPYVKILGFYQQGGFTA